MITRLSTVSELKQIFVETLLNNTDKLSKVSDNSVNNGIAFGVAKIAQKAIKDIAIVEAHTMVDSAYGDQLDSIADARGVSGRWSSADSSTYIRLVGDVGTVYFAGTNSFTGFHGVNFNLEEDVTIGLNGYAYGKIRSQTSGEETNVDPNTLLTVYPEPNGHTFCTNEYASFGGRNTEDDDTFKKRIKDGANLAATDTLSRLTQIANKINNSVMRIFYHGTNSQSQIILAVSTSNGVGLTEAELNAIEVRMDEFLAISDLKPYGSNSSNIELINIEYQTIDITFRAEILPSFDSDLVRKNIQVAMSKYLDFRFWEPEYKVDWDELLFIAKKTEGVKYVPDTEFIPSADIIIDNNKLPRIRAFIMLDLNGEIISNNDGTLNPVYYPTDPDSSYQQTILASI
jgi:hypothetical protein